MAVVNWYGYWRWVRWFYGLGEYAGKAHYLPYRPSPNPETLPRWMALAWHARRRVWWAARQAAQKPPPFDPLAFWRSRGVWFAWGIEDGSITPSRMVEIAKSLDCQWVGIQDGPQARARRAFIRTACQTSGLKLVIWQDRPTLIQANETIGFWSPDAYSANIEERRDWMVLAEEVRDAHPTLPLGVFTNLWGAGATPEGYSVEEARVWWGNGWACITESYMVNEQGPQPSLHPEILGWTARVKCQYPGSFPAFGIYRCPVSFYDEIKKNWPYHSWYLGEYV